MQHDVMVVGSAQWTVHSGQWTVNSEQWTVDSGALDRGLGQWTLEMCETAEPI